MSHCLVHRAINLAILHPAVQPAIRSVKSSGHCSAHHKLTGSVPAGMGASVLRRACSSSCAAAVSSASADATFRRTASSGRLRPPGAPPKAAAAAENRAERTGCKRLVACPQCSGTLETCNASSHEVAGFKKWFKLSTRSLSNGCLTPWLWDAICKQMYAAALNANLDWKETRSVGQVGELILEFIRTGLGEPSSSRLASGSEPEHMRSSPVLPSSPLSIAVGPRRNRVGGGAVAAAAAGGARAPSASSPLSSSDVRTIAGALARRRYVDWGFWAFNAMGLSAGSSATQAGHSHGPSGTAASGGYRQAVW